MKNQTLAWATGVVSAGEEGLSEDPNKGHRTPRRPDGLLRENRGQYGRPGGPCQPIVCRLRQGLWSPIMVALMTFGRLIVKETGTSRCTPNTSSRRIDRRILAKLAVTAEVRPDTRPSDLAPPLIV